MQGFADEQPRPLDPGCGRAGQEGRETEARGGLAQEREWGSCRAERACQLGPHLRQALSPTRILLWVRESPGPWRGAQPGRHLDCSPWGQASQASEGLTVRQLQGLGGWQCAGGRGWPLSSLTGPASGVSGALAAGGGLCPLLRGPQGHTPCKSSHSRLQRPFRFWPLPADRAQGSRSSWVRAVTSCKPESLPRWGEVGGSVKTEVPAACEGDASRKERF